jgi:flagellum-specific ATP synthase
VVNRVTSSQQRTDATALRRLLGALRDVRDLVDVGAYVPGSNPLADAALARQGAIETFLKQPVDQIAASDESWQALHLLVSGIPGVTA